MKTKDYYNFSHEAVLCLIKDVFPQWSDGSLSLRVVGDYSTPLSIVWRVAVESDNENRFVFIKRERKDTEDAILKREYENIVRFSSFYKDQHLHISNLIFFSEENNLLILNECRGETFLEVIKRECGWLDTVVDGKLVYDSAQAIGYWLNEHEEKTSQCSSKIEILENIELEISNYESRLLNSNIYKKILPLLELCKSILNCNLEKSICSDSLIYFAHGDFHPGNIFVDKDLDVHLIDFQHVGPRIIGYDALYFELTLLLSFGPSRYSYFRISETLKSFYKGYKRGLKPLVLQIPVLKALIVLRTLVYLSSISGTNNLLSRLACEIDLGKLNNWLKKQ